LIPPAISHKFFRAQTSVGKTRAESDLNQTLKSCKPDEFKLKLNSPTL